MAHRRHAWMWIEACELLERAERLQRHFFEPGDSVARRRTWIPPADVLENGDEVWVLVALPGVPPEHIHVAVDTNDLRVAGERAIPAEMRRALIHRLEIPYGRFERSIVLPPGRYELTHQDLVDGCLVLCLAKLE